MSVESIKATARDSESELIRSALGNSFGNVTKTAEILGMSVATLSRRLRSYAIVASEFRREGPTVYVVAESKRDEGEDWDDRVVGVYRKAADAEDHQATLAGQNPAGLEDGNYVVSIRPMELK